MKQLSIRNLFWAIGLLMTLPLVAQVSHGGHPLPLSALRSAESDWLVEMPITGFLFPAFNDRSTDLHSMLYFKKKPGV